MQLLLSPTGSEPFDALRQNPQAKQEHQETARKKPGRGSQTLTTRATKSAKRKEPKNSNLLGATNVHHCLREEIQEKPCTTILSTVNLETLHASWRPPSGPEKLYDRSKRSHSMQRGTHREPIQRRGNNKDELYRPLESTSKPGPTDETLKRPLT